VRVDRPSGKNAPASL